MSILVEFSILPVGEGVSLSPVIAKIMNVVMESGVSYKANPMGTVLEGEWDAVMAVIRRCHAEVMKDAERAITSIKIDDRGGSGFRMEKKLESVERILGKQLTK